MTIIQDYYFTIKSNRCIYPSLVLACATLNALIHHHSQLRHPIECIEQQLTTIQNVNHYSDCTTSSDCAFNGECIKPSNGTHEDDDDDDDPERTGYCSCFAGWKGSTCEILNVLPVDPEQMGLQLPNHDSSTWGGSVEYDEHSQLYHMFASEIVNNCGLYSWTTNSQVIRAVSKSPYGPYQKEQVIVPIFAHDANVMRAPTGEWVLLVTARTAVKPRDCRHNNTKAYHATTTTATRLPPPKDTFMLWALRPEGPWSKPIMVLNSTKYNADYWAKVNQTAICDTNLNGIILQNHMLVGIWRRCETDELLTIPHLLTASDWRNASTYTPHINRPLVVLSGSGAEDPSNLWMTRTSDMKPNQVALHVLFHDEQATRCMLGYCGGLGRHAVSLTDVSGSNGSRSSVDVWRYATVNAYDRHFTFINGTKVRADTRARPHMVLHKTSRQPIAVSTGLKERDESGYCYTLVTPLRLCNFSYE